jgi:hypothetical protein
MSDDSVVPFPTMYPGLPREFAVRMAKVFAAGNPIVRRAIDDMRGLGLTDNEVSSVLEVAAAELYVSPFNNGNCDAS